MSRENLEILKTMCLTWSDSDVYEAWNIIAVEGKRRKEKTTVKLKEELKHGDKVSFEGRKSGKCTGNIIKIKRKNAIVSVSGKHWNVPINMLSKI